MLVEGKHFHTIWISPSDEIIVEIIDQRHLPHQFIVEKLTTVEDCHVAIRDMHVRGAGCIGATAAYGMYLSLLNLDKSQDLEYELNRDAELLLSARPTAVNLQHAVEHMHSFFSSGSDLIDLRSTFKQAAIDYAQQDILACQAIGQHGLGILQERFAATQDVVNILTHCNAGWLAFVDHGSATAPIYAAHDAGIPVHVWVDETRPRNQGAALTVWELEQHGVPCSLIPDNTGGHLMQRGLVDMVIVGSDRTTASGDVCNKIGTYLKALAAFDNQIPFYAAMPSSTIDWTIHNGLSIPIEERDTDEIKYVEGWIEDSPGKVLITTPGAKAVNYAFDVTPARLVTGIITERGLCKPNRQDLAAMYPDQAHD